MANGIYPAVSGAVGSSQHLDVVANNLANIATSGFKAQRVAFAEVLAAKVVATDPQPETRFSELAATTTDFSQGGLRASGNPLDVALDGPGFLVVDLGQGKQAYTRGGALSINTKNQLVDKAGKVLLSEKGRPIEVKNGSAELVLASDGTLQDHEKNVIDRLKIVEFEELKGLTRVSDSHFAGEGLKERRGTNTRLRAGFVEQSNVNPVRGVNAMVQASRAYEAFHRVIQTFGEIDRQAARIAQQ